MSNNIYLEKVSFNAVMPTKGSTHAACFDLYADLIQRSVKYRDSDNTEHVHNTAIEGEYITLQPNQRALIPTGWKMQCPENMSIDFLPRSGTAWKEGVSVVNTPGIIDHDYQHECFVAVINHSDKPYTIKHGERIAQMRLSHVIPTSLMEVEELPPVRSNRDGGFGSTGK